MLCAFGYILAGSGCSLVAINTYRYRHRSLYLDSTHPHPHPHPHPPSVPVPVPVPMPQLFDPTLISGPAWTWLVVFASVIFSTIHVSDLPDVGGDRTRNRQTLPVVLGVKQTAVFSSVVVAAWSVLLGAVAAPAHPSCAFLCVALGGMRLGFCGVVVGAWMRGLLRGRMSLIRAGWRLLLFCQCCFGFERLRGSLGLPTFPGYAS
ncbi:hypothetical protein BO70DRAFT_128716 [Aspergillus heteromorphus CBS 117.55]|uniref:UbiA prenyltransferase n=1 Tax=Aspergillus heteromorphus CBS 117.55 TaxID=1448321 RepID=A0A317WYC7_9EURO|nr:uncharacterized protein BO70DRAFT_128716 [Aspergillus heteromorphus CBS 117.55]PWY89788.1 hypothetical protein BO70DRAFT_128716 [Aspergillus heteromorphus CBS 117.55]